MRLLACSLSVLISPLAAQELIERSYDLRPLTAPLPGFVGKLDTPRLLLPIGPVLRGEDRHDGILSDGGALHTEPCTAPQLRAAELFDRLEQLWAPESGTGEHDNVTLSLRAPASVHTRVHDMLSLFAAIRRQSRRLTLFELPANAATDMPAVLTAAQVTQLLQTVTPIQATMATVGVDTPWLWESGKSSRYVRDFDVEVAEKSSISDPKVDVFFAGTRVGLCITPMVDGRCLVRFGLQSSHSTESLTSRLLKAQGLGALHLPTVAVLEATASAAIASGGAMLISGDKAKRSWLLRLEDDASPPLQFGAAKALALGDLAVAPLSNMSSRELRLVHRPEGHVAVRSNEVKAPDALATLNNLLNGNLGSDPAQTRTFGSHIVLTGAGAMASAVEDKLQQRARGTQPTSVMFRLGTVANARALALLAGTTSADDLAGELPIAARTATLPEHNFAITLGRELSYVADLEVEIASKASASNPVIRTAFDGFRISGTLHRAPGEKPRVLLRLQWSTVAPFEPLDLANSALGTVDPLVSSWTDVEQAVAVTGDGWQLAHVQPDPTLPAERSLVLMMRTR